MMPQDDGQHVFDLVQTAGGVWIRGCRVVPGRLRVVWDLTVSGEIDREGMNTRIALVPCERGLRMLVNVAYA